MIIPSKAIGGASVLVGAMLVLVANLAQAQTTPAPAAATAAPTRPVGANEIFARWDKDHNKSLSPEEFKAGWDALQANMLVLRLHENFVAMDANHDGVLEAAEYANLELVKKAGASAPPLATFDANKSQTLDFKEYLEFVKTMMKSKP